jgi:uncharacterized protein (DUF1697 family)
MTRYAVLLRGINVGRANRIRMADLRGVLTEAGHGNVATLSQSGNIALDAAGSAAGLARSVERLVKDHFGYEVNAIVRTREQLRRVVAADPFGAVADDGSRYLVVFLAGRPDVDFSSTDLADALAGVDARDDRYLLSGTELYVWCPHSMLDSPVMTMLGRRRGGPPATVRNWNTVQKLEALLR